MEIKSDNDRLLLLCAFNYALGRMTYVISAVAEEILNNWELLKQSDKERIVKDIENAIEVGSAGMEMDVMQWRRVLERYYGYNG